MKNWFYKTFRKKSTIKAVILLPNRRVLTYYRVPVADEVEIIGVGNFQINDSDYALSGSNIPTYYYEYGEFYPLKMKHKYEYTETELQWRRTPLQRQKALRNKVVEKLQEVMKPQIIDMQTLIIIGVNILGLVGVYYLLNESLAIIIEKLTTLGI